MRPETDTAARLRVPNRDFTRLWISSGASAVGDGMTLTAAPLLASHLTDDARLIGAVSAVATIPFVLFGIPAGWLVDRVDIRAAMYRVDAFRAVLMAVLTAGIVFGFGGLPLLYACLFLIGTGETFFRNAAQALVPDITSRAGLTTANARIVATQEAGSTFFGPLAGAALFGLGMALPFGVDAASFLCSAVLLSRLGRRPASARPPAGIPLSGMLDGIRFLWRHHLLRTLSLLACAVNMVGTASLAVLVVHAHDVLHLGSFGFGVLLACQAAGAVGAGRLSSLLTDRVGREKTLVVAALMITAAETLLALSSSPYAAGAALALFACATVVWTVATMVLRQTLVPDHLRGRVNSVYRLVAWGGLPIGAAAGGVLAEASGTPAVYLASAVGTAAIALAVIVGAARHWIERAS
jgi:MFS family permease